MILRSLIPHLGLFGVAGVFALQAWLGDDDEAGKNKHTEAVLWSGKPADVQKIHYQGERNAVTIEPHEDELGRYFTGTMEKEKGTKPKPSPHGHVPEESPEQKAADDSAPKEIETIPFVSVKSATELAANVAPLKALRALGPLAEDRLGEFGLDKPEGKLEVTLGGSVHTLNFGSATPGGRDRYVQLAETGQGYVLSGDVANTLSQADTRLVEHALHSWELDEAQTVRIILGDKSRELVRASGQKDYWADPATPDAKDETASNWMDKVERLRINKFEPKPEPQPTPESVAARLEFFDAAKKPLGYLEVVRVKAEGNNEYLVKSEYTRWYGYVLRSIAEGIDQDAASVVSP